MLRVSLKGVWAHKRRLFGTVFAVLLGVAFLAGTLVLGDTMRAGFYDLFSEANRGHRRGRPQHHRGRQRSDPDARGLIDESLGDDDRRRRRCRRRGAAGRARSAQLVGKDGDPIGGNGPPTLAGSWTTEPRLNPWNVAEGRAPSRPGRR